MDKEQAIENLIAASKHLKQQWMREPLHTTAGQNASLRVIQAYDKLKEIEEN